MRKSPRRLRMEEGSGVSLPSVDVELLSTLIDLGFPEIRARKSLLAGCDNVEACAYWLVEHGDDEGIDDPIVPAPAAAETEEPDEIELYPEMNEALVAEVLSFGFPEVNTKYTFYSLKNKLDGGP